MDMPFVLKQAAEKLTDGLKPHEIKEHAERISRRYRDKNAAGRSAVGNLESAAYAVSRMPATFGAVSAVLRQAAACQGLPPKTMIDVGAGTGAAVWAAACFFDLEYILCLEREKAMRDTGRKLASAGSDFFKTAPVWREFDLAASPLTQTADLVTACYVLNELNEENRENALLKLWQAAKQMLVIVEPGTPENFLQMKCFRSFLIDRGAFIAAPCPHQNVCLNDWCHFGCRVARAKLHRESKGGAAPFEDEKFTYLIAVREKRESAGARILRRPLIGKGKVTLSLCASSGLTEKTVSKKDGEIYKKARKADWGDVFNPTE